MNLLYAALPAGVAAAGTAAFLARRWHNARLADLLARGRSLQTAADGRLALSGLLARSPGLDAEQLLERCAEFQERYHAACTAGQSASIGNVMLPGMRAAVACQNAMLAGVLRKVDVYDLTVAEAMVLEAFSDGVFDCVYALLRGETMRRTMHGATKHWLEGGKSPEPFREVWGLCRRVGVAARETPGTLEGFCPQCGDDLQEQGGSAVCTACGARLDDGSLDWAVTFVGTTDGWRPSDVPPPDVSEAGISLTECLDTVTALFWQVRTAELHADAERLAPVAAPAFLENHAAAFRAARDGKRTFHTAVNLGRIEWLGASQGRCRLRVFWSGIPVQARVPSFLQVEATRVLPRVDDFVLEPNPATAGAWRLAAMHRVQGEVPCAEQLDTLQETRRLERLPVMTPLDYDILLQTCAALLLRKGPLTGRRLSALRAVGALAGFPAERINHGIRAVETEGAALFGNDGKLPPEALLQHLVRLLVCAHGLRGPVRRLTRYLAEALDIAPRLPALRNIEQNLLRDTVRRIAHPRGGG